MSVIGTTLDRRRKLQDESRNRIRVNGWNGRAYVCESADEFGATFLLTEADLAADYGTKAEPPESEEDRMRRQDRAAQAKLLAGIRRRARVERELDPSTPEAELRAAAPTPSEGSPENAFVLAAESESTDG